MTVLNEKLKAINTSRNYGNRRTPEQVKAKTSIYELK